MAADDLGGDEIPGRVGRRVAVRQIHEGIDVGRLARQLGVRVLHYKMCSTFDSAPEVMKAIIHARPSLTWPPLFPLFEGQDPLGDPEALWDRVYEKTLHNGRRVDLLPNLRGTLAVFRFESSSAT